MANTFLPFYLEKLNKDWDKLNNIPKSNTNYRLLSNEAEIIAAQRVFDAVWIHLLFELNVESNVWVWTQSKKSFVCNPDILMKIPYESILGDFKITYNAKLDNKSFYNSDGKKNKDFGNWHDWYKGNDNQDGYKPVIVRIDICKRNSDISLFGQNIVWDTDKISYWNIAAEELNRYPWRIMYNQTGFNHIKGGSNDQKFNPQIAWGATCFPTIPVDEPPVEDPPGDTGGGTWLSKDDCPCEEILVEKTVYLRKTRMSDKDVPINIKSKREICKQKFTGKRYKFKCDEELFKEIKSGGGGGALPGGNVPQNFAFPNNIGSLGSLQSVGRKRR